MTSTLSRLRRTNLTALDDDDDSGAPATKVVAALNTPPLVVVLRRFEVDTGVAREAAFDGRPRLRPVTEPLADTEAPAAMVANVSSSWSSSPSDTSSPSISISPSIIFFLILGALVLLRVIFLLLPVAGVVVLDEYSAVRGVTGLVALPKRFTAVLSSPLSPPSLV